VLAAAVTSTAVGALAVPAAATNTPLEGGTSDSDGAWVVVPMGQLSDTSNTFWQLLHTPSGTSSPWSVVTPPGVADNGGLVASASGGSVLAGILPSGLLRFSPLAESADGGTTWNPVFLPAGLSAAPDVLAYRPGGPVSGLAVTGRRVLAAGRTLGSWSPLVSASQLRAADPRCGATGTQAVAFSPDGTTLVATDCTRGGVVGIFRPGGGGWHAVGVVLGGTLHGARTSVLRLETTGQTTTALVVATHGPHRAVIELRRSTGSWATSKPLPLASGSRILSTSLAPDGTVTLLLATERGHIGEMGAPGRPWSALPPVPRRTAALAGGQPVVGITGSPAAPLNAFTVNGAQLGVFALAPSGTRWVRTQSLRVPLAYGSSG
jgi:hypothetical protein